MVSSGLVGVGTGVMRLEPALSWIRDVKSRILLFVDDGVRILRLPEVVSGIERGNTLLWMT